MLEVPHHRVFLIATASLFISLVWGCRVANIAKQDSVNQNTPVAAETQTSKLVPIDGKNNPACPATVKVIDVKTSKPPLTFYQLKVRVVNRQPNAIWLLLRHDAAFPKTGQFACYKFQKHCFSTVQFLENGNKQAAKVVVISFLGVDSFSAIRMLPAGDITLDYYIMNTAEPVSDFEVWEVDSLLVNDKTPLEKWLPYPVLSDRVAHIGEQQKSIVLDLDGTLNNYRQDYPNEKVEFVTAKAIRKWLVPVTPSKQQHVVPAK